MKDTINELIYLLDDKKELAKYLEYSERHTRNILKKIRSGHTLNSRVEFWIKAKLVQRKREKGIYY